MNWAYQAVLPAAAQGAMPYSVTAGVGIFGLSGQEVRVSANRTFRSTFGYFQISGFVRPLMLRRLRVASLAIALGGKSTAIMRTRRLPPPTAAYRTESTMARLTTIRRMTAITTQYTVTAGVSVLRKIIGMIDAAGERIFVTGTPPAFEIRRRIFAGCGVFASSMEPADIETALTLTADSRKLDAQGQECSIAATRKILANPGVIAISCSAPACGDPPAREAPSALGIGVKLGL